MNTFEYYCQGELIAHFQIGLINGVNPRRCFILVRREPGDYVVALYHEGQTQWDSGYYTCNLQHAIERFNKMIAVSIDCQPTMPRPKATR